MHILIDRITQKTGLERHQSEAAVGVILNFIAKNSSHEDMERITEKFPAASEFLAIEETNENSGLFGGLASKMSSGVGILTALNELTGLGLSMGQIQQVVHETVAYTKEKAGNEAVDNIISKIPGLSQFT